MPIENTRTLTDAIFNARFDTIEETDLDKLTSVGVAAKSVDVNGTKIIHLNNGMGVVTIFKDNDRYVYDCSDEMEKVFLAFPITVFFDENVFVVIPMKTSI